MMCGILFAVVLEVRLVSPKDTKTQKKAIKSVFDGLKFGRGGQDLNLRPSGLNLIILKLTPLLLDYIPI